MRSGTDPDVSEELMIEIRLGPKTGNMVFGYGCRNYVTGAGGGTHIIDSF